MPKKQFPLHFECIIEIRVIRDILPVIVEIERVRKVRVPDRLWRVDPVLGLTGAQARDGATECAVYLQLQEVVTIDPDCPRRVELGNDLTLSTSQDKRRVSCIFSRA